MIGSYEEYCETPEKAEVSSTYERFLQMTPLGVVWHLLWDRYFGHQIQDRLKRGVPLDDEFCRKVKRQALAELAQLDSQRIKHVHIQMVHA